MKTAYRATALFLAFAFLLFSCAPRQAVKKPAPVLPAPAPGQEELKLPEPPGQQQQTEKKEEEPVRIEKGEKEDYIVLNFDNADLETVISTFGELLKVNYLLAPGITGKVTIQSYKKFPVKDLFRIFQNILELNGLTAVKDGPLYKIVPIDTAKQQPIPVEKGKGQKVVLDSGFVTQIIPLDYVKAGDIANILRTLMPRGTDLIIYEPANLLIVTALPETLARFMKIIEALDVSDTERESVKTFVYYVENGEAKKLADILKSIYPEKKETGGLPAPRTAIIPQRGVGGQGIQALPGEIGEMTVTAYDDINALVIKTTPRAYLSVLELLKRLDVPAKQVLIEVLVAEVTLSDSSQFGIEWLLNRTTGRPTYGGGFTQGASVNLDKTNPLGAAPTATPQVGLFTATLMDKIGSINLASALNALASQSKLNVIASPHILA